MRFIKLTNSVTSDDIFLNIENIIAVSRHDPESTRIYVIGGGNILLLVKEDPDFIINEIKKYAAIAL